MAHDFRVICFGIAAVVETALLVTLLDRRNWRFLELPMLLVVASAWTVHTAAFIHTLLIRGPVAWSPILQGVSSTAIAAGLAVFPCAMLHWMWRLWRSQKAAVTDQRYWIAYVPALLGIPTLFEIWRNPVGAFTVTLRPFATPYMMGMFGVFVAASAVAAILYRQTEQLESRRYLASHAAISVFSAGIFAVALWIGFDAAPRLVGFVALLLTIIPLLPVSVFAFFIVRHSLLPLILEQTVVYGSVVVAAFLFHRVAVTGLTDALESRYGIDFGLIEGLLVLAVILAYRPLRQRTSEALRYLLGARVTDARHQEQQLAVDLSKRSDVPTAELLDWFVESLAHVFTVPFVMARVQDADEEWVTCCGNVAADKQTLFALQEELLQHDLEWCNRRTAPTDECLDLLTNARVGLAIRTGSGDLQTLFLFAERALRSGIGEEEISAGCLLAEQFAITIHSRHFRQRLLTVERRALDAEKLSALGLLASCLAHEVKNPLSSIKTIITVMSEELGREHRHATDLDMVISEVDRLTSRTNELLGFARPADEEKKCDSLAQAIGATVQFLDYAARKRGVEITTSIGPEVSSLSAPENAVRDILFNLVLNAIEAAGHGGLVSIDCAANGKSTTTTVTDTGPGISDKVKETLFEPFATTKESGTGLGLFIVRRRVAELGGEISCDSTAGQGTSFAVKLPL